jgi:hypothetical protein
MIDENPVFSTITAIKSTLYFSVVPIATRVLHCEIPTPKPRRFYPKEIYMPILPEGIQLPGEFEIASSHPHE